MTGTIERKPSYERLKTSLTEAIEFAHGKRALKITVISDPPPAFNAQDILRLRRHLKLSQRTRPVVCLKHCACGLTRWTVLPPCRATAASEGGAKPLDLWPGSASCAHEGR